MVGSQSTIVVGKNVTITFGGSVYAEAEECRLLYNYRVLEEEVAGTFTPAYGTGVFHGEVQLSSLYSTDIDFITLTTPGSNGDLPVSSCSMQLKGTSGATKTVTIQARINETEIVWTKGRFVVANARGIATGPFTSS